MTRTRFLALATFTLLVAAVLRIWQLSAYPPGPHYDEAAELLIARSITFGGARFFPMVEAYQGREVLFYYLAAPLLQSVNDGIFSLRLLSVYCNLIAIAASVALGRVLFRGRRGVVVGLAAGVLMTLSFPMIWMSRQAFRSSALPLMQALALLFLFRGLREKRAQHVAPLQTSPPSPLHFVERGEHPLVRRKFGWRGITLLVLGGIFAGGAIYTYNSSRLFPFWLLVAGIALLGFDRRYWRRRLGQGVAFFVPLAVVAAPMAIYAVQRPDVFWGRLSEVTQADKSVTLAQSVVLHLKMFFIQGDPYFRYNAPGRPYFTWPEGALLLLGLALAAYRVTRRREAPTERAAYLLALLSPLMVIPSVVSVGGLPPSNMRSLGMVPLIFVLVGIGAEWVVGRAEMSFAMRRRGINPLAKDSSRPLKGRPFPNPFRVTPSAGRHVGVAGRLNVQRGVTGLVILVLFLGGGLVGAEYFAWARDPALFYEEDADLALAAKWLVANHGEGEPVFLAARDKGHPTVMIQPVPPITWLGTDSLFAPAPGETGLYVFPRSAPPPADWVAWLTPGAVPGLPLGPDGQPAFQAYRITGEGALPVDAPGFEAQNAYLTFVGYSAASVVAGVSGSISMAWRIDAAPPSGDFTPLLALEDAHGSQIYRGDAYMAGTDEWRAGETLIQRMSITVPPATPPGKYVVKIAWVGRASNTYAAYVNSGGESGAVWAQIGTLTVTRPASFPDPAALPIGVRQPTEVAPGVALLGWDAPPSSIRPGETLAFTLYWQAKGAVRPAFSLRARLGDVRLWTGQPIDDRYPADRWADGEVLADRVLWTVPRETPPGDAPLTIEVGDTAVNLGIISVAGMPRQFDAPPVEHVTNVNFGGQFLLYGYSLRPEGDKLSLVIVWKALHNTSTNYKIFIHLVDRDGVILAQRDAMPQADTYPTSLWLSGEYVVDTHELPTLPNGSALRIGLYSPETAVRLPLVGQSLTSERDYFVVALQNQ